MHSDAWKRHIFGKKMDREGSFPYNIRELHDFQRGESAAAAASPIKCRQEEALLLFDSRICQSPHTNNSPPLLIPNPVYTGSPSSSSFLLCHLRRCRVDQNRFFSLRKKIRARWINNHPFFSPGIVFSPFSPNAGK